ncbi:uncharacterized protein LOC129569492, partial [Sitodiplosis mosellana]|uniref:uncharacterized protein LOC129569492 n=1 Tax=Sitodiplosis mosellana TaxID=263140 RepID=UPI002444AE3A
MPSSNTLPDYITSHVHEIAKSEGFTSYTIESKAGSNHGDNLVAIMNAITLCGTKTENCTTEKLHLLCKEAPANETRRKHFNSEMIFNREIFVYSKILPAFARFQKEKGLSEADSFVSFPEVYAFEANQDDGSFLLIMEDLKAKNYKMWPKEKIIALDHELLVMKNLAKFHAISFAMKDQRPNEFDEFTRLQDTFVPIVVTGKMRSFNNKSIERAANVLKRQEHKKLMLDFLHTFGDTIKEFLCGASSREFGVIGHGDCWNNNFMFSYFDEQGKSPKDVSFLDWQLTHYCPP